ncbi:serine/threonine-protein kinase VRK1 [Tachysurus ichikawai]
MPFAYGRCHQGAGLCQLRTPKRKKAAEKETSNNETDRSPAKKRRPAQKKVNGVKKTAVKKSSPTKRFIDSGTQTSPAAATAVVEAKRGRGRPKKTA